MDKSAIQDLGQRFGELFYTGSINTAIAYELGEISIEDAFKVQDEAIGVRKAKGEHIGGYKVGCTSEAIRRQFNLSEPCHGKLPREHIHPAQGKSLELSDYVGCAIEPELVMCIGRDLDGENLDDDYLKGSIAYLSPGIEVHNYKFWFGQPTAQELIMSNCLFACLLVGAQKVKAESFDFKNALFSVWQNDNLATKGIAAQIMGGPLESLKWLVRALANRGETLEAGHFVIPGSPVELIRIEEDSHLKIEISSVGSVSADFRR